MTIYELLILVGVPSILTLIFQVLAKFLYERNRKKKNEDDDIRLGVQALLRNELQRQGKFYTEEAKYCRLSDKENYDNMYQRYHNLGKNGVMDALHDEVMGLPISKGEDRNGLLEV